MKSAVTARAKRLGTAGGVPLVLCALCCTEPADVPDVPDLESLREQYDDPTGTLADGAAVQRLIERFPQLPELAEVFRTTRALVARADEGRDAADDRDGRGIQLRGSIDVTVRCPGDGRDVAEPGTLSIELAVTRSVIRQSFWTRARDCLFQTEVAGVQIPIEVDGDLALDLGSDIPLGGTWPTSPMLVSFTGTLALSGVEFGDLSARVDDESFEYLQPVEDGSVILFVTSSGVGLRDARTTWYCGTDNSACAVD